jgi:hypothetical protein
MRSTSEVRRNRVKEASEAVQSLLQYDNQSLLGNKLSKPKKVQILLNII